MIAIQPAYTSMLLEFVKVLSFNLICQMMANDVRNADILMLIAFLIYKM